MACRDDAASLTALQFSWEEKKRKWTKRLGKAIVRH
jgi:hypothetical protein